MVRSPQRGVVLFPRGVDLQWIREGTQIRDASCGFCLVCGGGWNEVERKRTPPIWRLHQTKAHYNYLNISIISSSRETAK